MIHSSLLAIFTRFAVLFCFVYSVTTLFSFNPSSDTEAEGVMKRLHPLDFATTKAVSLKNTTEELKGPEQQNTASKQQRARAESGIKLENKTGPHLQYFIVTTGHELLEGIYQDSHTCFLTRTLHPLGAECVGSIAVDDQMSDIQQALAFALKKAPVVIVTGGLGPTEDDITRQCLSQFTGIALQEHPALLSEMSQRFKQKTEDIRPNLRRQTLVPVKGTYLPNKNGTAAGLIFELSESLIIALPGPPKELQPMVNDALVPWLAKRFQTHTLATTLMIRFVGVGQSQIAQTIKDRIALPPEIKMYSQFEEMRVDFTFALPGNETNNRLHLQSLEKQIQEALGDYIYANDPSTLEEKVAQKMLLINPNLSLLEVGSGGQLAAAFNTKSTKLSIVSLSAPTLNKLCDLLHFSSAKLSVGIPNDQDLLRLSEEINTQQNTWVIVVGEKEMNPTGPRMRVLLRTPSKLHHFAWIALGQGGEINYSRLTTQILNFVWRNLR